MDFACSCWLDMDAHIELPQVHISDRFGGRTCTWNSHKCTFRTDLVVGHAHGIVTGAHFGQIWWSDMHSESPQVHI